MMSSAVDVRIVFTANTIWQSRAIRWILDSPVSHTYVEYPSSMWGGRWAAEATTHGGVRKVPDYKAYHHVYAEFECLFDMRPGFSAVRKYFGEKYDYVGAGWLGVLGLFWKWFRRKVRNPLWASNAQFCSEFVSRILIACGLPNTEKWNPELATPKRIYKYCLKHGELFKPLRLRGRRVGEV